MAHDIKIGDRITFCAVTRWSGATVTRVVNGFLMGRPTVRYGGWSDFLVRPDEIVSVTSASKAAA